MVEHLKVMAALTVEPASASLSVEPPVGSSPGGRATKVSIYLLGGGRWSSPPPGPLPVVEQLKFLAFLTSSKHYVPLPVVEPPVGSLH